MLILAGISLWGDCIVKFMRKFVLASARKTSAGKILPTLLALSAALAPALPAQAAGSADDAEKLRRLDIMLMVTGLRCRATSDNFTTEYGRFTSKHMGTLNGANSELRSDLSRRVGEKSAKRALDRLSVTMANQYGRGHPWLDCGQLKMVAGNLAQTDGRASLLEAANQLLSVRPIEHFALAER